MRRGDKTGSLGACITSKSAAESSYHATVISRVKCQDTMRRTRVRVASHNFRRYSPSLGTGTGNVDACDDVYSDTYYALFSSPRASLVLEAAGVGVVTVAANLTREPRAASRELRAPSSEHGPLSLRSALFFGGPTKKRDTLAPTLALLLDYLFVNDSRFILRTSAGCRTHVHTPHTRTRTRTR